MNVIKVSLLSLDTQKMETFTPATNLIMPYQIMPNVTQTVTNYLGGVSRQPIQKKYRGSY